MRYVRYVRKDISTAPRAPNEFVALRGGKFALHTWDPFREREDRETDRRDEARGPTDLIFKQCVPWVFGLKVSCASRSGHGTWT